MYVITAPSVGSASSSQICSNDDPSKSLSHFIRWAFVAALCLRGPCKTHYTRCHSGTHFPSVLTTLVSSGKRDLPWTGITCQWRRSRTYTVSSSASKLTDRVWNEAPSENLTMHWHGISQYGSPFSDGTPSASQWPIPPGKYFDYEFMFADDLDGTL